MVSAHAANEIKAGPVSVAQTLTRTLEIKVKAPGELESLADPVIAAEVAVRVLEVLVEEGGRLIPGNCWPGWIRNPMKSPWNRPRRTLQDRGLDRQSAAYREAPAGPDP